MLFHFSPTVFQVLLLCI